MSFTIESPHYEGIKFMNQCIMKDDVIYTADDRNIHSVSEDLQGFCSFDKENLAAPKLGSKSFKKLRALQQERVSKHEYPHRMSRKGYANLAEEIEKSTPPKKKRVGKELFVDHKVKDATSLTSPLKALHIVMEMSYKGGRGLRVTMVVDVFGNCIVVYMWHLYRTMKEKNEKFMFVNPFCVSQSHHLSVEERARALADRQLTATPNQLVLAPCNMNLGKKVILDFRSMKFVRNGLIV